MNGDAQLILDAIKETNRRIGSIEKNVREDVQRLHKKIDDVINDGIPKCDTEELKIQQNAKDILDLKNRPQKSVGFFTSILAIIMSLIAIISFVASCGARI